jgi:hypothetical protein
MSWICCSRGTFLVLRQFGATAEALNNLSERFHRGVQSIGGAAADDMWNCGTQIYVAM